VKVLVDTNVLLSAAISEQGVCAGIVEELLAEHTVVLAEFVLNEFIDKLQHKLKVPLPVISIQVERLRHFCVCIALIVPDELICRDADDDGVLAAARFAQVDALLTGDKDLLELPTLRSFVIVAPRQWRSFADAFAARGRT